MLFGRQRSRAPDFVSSLATLGAVRGFGDFEVCASPPCPAVFGWETPGAWAAPGFSFMGACAVGANFSFVGACTAGAGCFSFMGACAVGVGDFCDTLPG